MTHKNEFKNEILDQVIDSRNGIAKILKTIGDLEKAEGGHFIKRDHQVTLATVWGLMGNLSKELLKEGS